MFRNKFVKKSFNGKIFLCLEYGALKFQLYKNVDRKKNRIIKAFEMTSAVYQCVLSNCGVIDFAQGPPLQGRPVSIAPPAFILSFSTRLLLSTLHYCFNKQSHFIVFSQRLNMKFLTGTMINVFQKCVFQTII